MSLTVVLKNRSFGYLFTPPDLEFRVNSYAHNAIGGPKRASITAYSEDPRSLWELLEVLRCPVEISDEHGRFVWWGYVSEVTVRVDAVQVGVSLDQMSNKIRVTYTRPDNSATDPTAWADDADSQAEYGVKEAEFGVGYCEDAQALVYRDELLRRLAKPISKPGLSGAEKSMSVNLSCRGWWDTLDWRYYAKATTATVATSTQIINIVSAVGPFFTGVDVETASGISGSEYRKGDRKALKEITDLMASGVSGGRRFLATVDIKRSLRIYQEPTTAQAVYFNSAGEMTDILDVGLDKSVLLCGIWANLKNIIPANVNMTRLSDASKFFIEEAEYIVQSDRVNWVARDTPLPGNFSGVR